MQTNNLQELRSLRIQEKAIKARIETIMPIGSDKRKNVASAMEF